MQLHDWFYDISQIMMEPVLWLIYLLFIYSLFETGRFLMMAALRYRNRAQFDGSADSDGDFSGYPIVQFHQQRPDASLNEIEVYALQQLETVRLVTRVCPMLGLIATLIPMGPALMSLTENNVALMGQLLRTAFTAVILALAAASLTFWVAGVKKRWFAEEITRSEKSFQPTEVER